MEGESGSIQTPRYPLDYPVDKVCSWIIRLQPGEKVVLSFETFSLEDHLFCQYDYVIIRDGSSSKSPMVGKFCGEDRPATITSTSNHLWIDFRSDSSTTAQGFKAAWKTEKIEISSTSTISTTKPSPTPTTAKGLILITFYMLESCLFIVQGESNCQDVIVRQNNQQVPTGRRTG